MPVRHAAKLGRSALAVAAVAAMFGTAAASVTGSATPSWSIAKAEAAIEALVGKQFFHDNFVFASDLSTSDPGSPDCTNCTELVRKPRHNLTWRFRVANRPFIDEVVLVVVSPDGELLSAPEGVPNCRETPSLCRFPIDETDALRIARENDFETGTEPWTASFHYVYGTLQRFVWDVSTKLSDDPSGKSEGRILTIDASSGAVISVGGWFAWSCRFDRP